MALKWPLVFTPSCVYHHFCGNLWDVRAFLHSSIYHLLLSPYFRALFHTNWYVLTASWAFPLVWLWHVGGVVFAAIIFIGKLHKVWGSLPQFEMFEMFPFFHGHCGGVWEIISFPEVWTAVCNKEIVYVGCGEDFHSYFDWKSVGKTAYLQCNPKQF